jgi:radical SAM superfamily enzyme YgiQ (UPF0313 family)
MFKALLCIPPNYCYTYDFPPLATPMLSGYLKDKGIEVIQADYNMGYLDYLKRRVFNSGAFGGISNFEASFATTKLLNKIFEEKLKKNYYYSSLLSPDPLGIFYDDNTNSSFHFVERLLSSEYLIRYIEDRKENTFLQFFIDEAIVSQVEKQGINLIGISITAPSQAIGAFTLGSLIKQALKDVRIAIGGQWVSLFREELKKRPDWQRFFDYIIIFEGETPFYSLADSIYNNKDLSSVPNLIYKADSQWVQSEPVSKEDLNKLSCPDFEGLPLKEYLEAERSGKITLTYQTARECYWNKCIYCVDLPLPKYGYRERDMDLIVDDIKKLITKHKMSFLEISNPTVSAEQLKRLSERIIREKLDFSWWCFVRLDKGFTNSVLELAKNAGCKSLAFGLESGSQRVLDFIRKGIDIDDAKRIIMGCYNAGINVHLQMMLGLPTETIDEALETIKFLVDYRGYIADVSFNIYYVTPSCKVYLYPQQYGIDFKRYPDLPFKFFHEFSHISGEVSKDKAYGLIQLYRQLLLKKKAEANNAGPAVTKNADSRLVKSNLPFTVGEDTVSILYGFDKDKKEGIILDSTDREEDVQARYSYI